MPRCEWRGAGFGCAMPADVGQGNGGMCEPPVRKDGFLDLCMQASCPRPAALPPIPSHPRSLTAFRAATRMRSWNLELGAQDPLPTPGLAAPPPCPILPTHCYYYFA